MIESPRLIRQELRSISNGELVFGELESLHCLGSNIKIEASTPMNLRVFTYV